MRYSCPSIDHQISADQRDQSRVTDPSRLDQMLRGSKASLDHSRRSVDHSRRSVDQSRRSIDHSSRSVDQVFIKELTGEALVIYVYIQYVALIFLHMLKIPPGLIIRKLTLFVKLSGTYNSVYLIFHCGRVFTTSFNTLTGRRTQKLTTVYCNLLLLFLVCYLPQFNISF